MPNTDFLKVRLFRIDYSINTTKYMLMLMNPDQDRKLNPDSVVSQVVKCNHDLSPPVEAIKSFHNLDFRQ